MEKTKRNWDIITDEKRKEIIQEIIDFFQSERNEKIGIIAAEEILDFFLQSMGKDLYNKGVKDSTDFLKNRLEDIELDMEGILKQ